MPLDKPDIESGVDCSASGAYGRGVRQSEDMEPDIVRRAILVFGEQQQDDYVLAPLTHSDIFEPTIPTFSALLQDPGITQRASIFERSDREAVSAQTRYKRAMHRANLSVFGAGTLSAATIVVGLFSGELGQFATKLLLLCCGLGALLPAAWPRGSFFTCARANCLRLG